MPKKTIILMLILYLASYMISIAEENYDNREGIYALAWLEGFWEGDFEGNRFTAVYSSPEGGVILSASKEYNGGQCTFFEYEMFFEDNGAVYMRPYPRGVASVVFHMASYDPEEKLAVFENPEHDFPTDISYQLIEDSMLQISVGGPYQDGRRVLTARLTRVEKETSDSLQIESRD